MALSGQVPARPQAKKATLSWHEPVTTADTNWNLKFAPEAACTFSAKKQPSRL